MIPAAFEYDRPETLEQAIDLLVKHGEDAKVLAGGHSLIPAMKLRLAQPRAIIDVSRVPGLKQMGERNGTITLGAMLTHHEIESSAFLRDRCPLFPEVARHIGDVQVRNLGTLGGSLVHADPAADWPAAILALDAELEIAGPSGRRIVKATDFFIEMMQSAVQPNEILCQIRCRATPPSVAYVKFTQKASGFAIAGVAAVVDKGNKTVRVGVTGAAPKPYRASSVEEALKGQELTAAAIEAAAAKADEGVETLNDIHASAEYRGHLTQVNTRRALTLAAGR